MVELYLPDMSCSHCVAVVTRTVQQLDPAARLSFDLPGHRVQIESTVDAAALKAALADEGYPAA